jgi:hypothetical protein
MQGFPTLQAHEPQELVRFPEPGYGDIHKIPETALARLQRLLGRYPCLILVRLHDASARDNSL